MRAVVQRVSEARVQWNGGESAIGAGYVILLGVAQADAEQEADLLAAKIAKLRVFSDADGKFNLDSFQVGAEFLIVSQFTLFADARGQNRPSFLKAAPPDRSIPLIERFVQRLQAGGAVVRTGSFGAQMRVSLCNEGPVTIVLSTDPWDPRIVREARGATTGAVSPE